jgi:DNA replication ATP-dependent helicase Dna2
MSWNRTAEILILPRARADATRRARSLGEALLYRLSKRVISQFIRTGCRRRLRLDLYAGVRDRAQADVPAKDSSRPGLALLTQQGKQYERAKFLELETIFPDHVLRGPLKPFDVLEERVFEVINLGDHIDGLQPHQFVLEAQFEITPSFRAAHNFADLEDGSAVADGQRLGFENLRPDIIHVVPPSNNQRRIIAPSGRLDRIGPADLRLGLQLIDIKISGEASPAHFSELAYYGMALAGWLEDTGRADRFVVLSEAAIWPGSHDGSTMHKFDREDRANNVPRRDLNRYLDGLDEDLEVMPPEVVIGRIQRFLSVDLREVLAAPDWRALPWHIDHKCSGCDYLGYRWSRHDDENSETAPARGAAPDGRYCWPMAEREGHLSRVAGLTEGASGKLREFNIGNVAAVSVLPAGSPAFERHQALRAKRTVLRERAVVLNEQRPAAIADRAGTSAILPRFADIRVAVSIDFDIGSGLTFAVGYRIDYGVPNAFQPRGNDGPRYGRVFHTIERPLLVLERSLQAEGEIVRLWLDHLVADIHRLQGEILAGYRQNGSPDKKDVTLQFFLWDRLTFDHLCRVFGRHLDLLQAPVRIGQVDVSPMAWVFPADAILDEPGFVGRASPISIVSDAVSSLMAAPIPHHYGVIDFANSIEPESRLLANGQSWAFHINKFYRDPLSDQIPSERGHEIWEHAAPFADRDFQWHQETVRHVVKRKLHAISYVSEKLTRLLGDSLTAEAPAVGSIFQGSDRLTGVGDDGQIIYQHARLMAAAQRLEVDLLMAMPPHEREARFRSARIGAVLVGDARRTALGALGLNGHVNDPRVLVLRLSERSKEARLKKGEYTWSLLPEADLPDLQDLTVAQFKSLHPDLANRNPIQHWEYRKKLREDMTVTILEVDRGACLLVVIAGRLIADALQLDLLQMDLDEARGRFAILDPIVMDVFTGKLKKALSDQTGIRNPPIAQNRPLFPDPSVAHVRAGRPRGSQANGAAAEFIWNADVMAGSDSGVGAGPLLVIAERIAPGLTDRQNLAIRAAVERRFSLWWGPPGTGKSRTAQAYVTALASDAVAAGRPLRIAITGFTWVAIDNIAKRLPELLRAEEISDQVILARLSSTENADGVEPRLRDFLLPMGDVGGEERIELERRLSECDGVTIVASTVDQMFKLGDPAICAPLFDIILIDEASQLDVGHAIVGLTKLADGGRVTVVGDDKQMAPIHPMESPEGIEHLLGSVYDFYRHYRMHEGPDFPITPIMLNRSFRSNREIIEFVREAGYGDDLEAAAANRDLRIATGFPYPDTRPADWPVSLPWSAHFGEVLAANEPTGSAANAMTRRRISSLDSSCHSITPGSWTWRRTT